MGRLLGKNCLAMDWLMTTTGAEVAALEQGDVHGANVSGGGEANGDLGLLRHGDGGMAFDGDGLVGATLQWEIVDCACGVDAGEGADALEDAVEELRFLGGV